MTEIESAQKLETKSQIGVHIIFAGIYPLIDLGSHVIFLLKLCQDEFDLVYKHIILCCMALIIPILGRIIYALNNEKTCPYNNRTLGVLLQIFHLHSLYNVWRDVRKGKKGGAGSMAMLLELSGEVGIETLLKLAYLLSPNRWSTWNSRSTWSLTFDIVNEPIIALAAISLVSLAYGTVTTMIQEALRDKLSGGTELNNSWLSYFIFTLHFLVSALLSEGAYAVFFASFPGRFFFPVYLFAAMVLRPFVTRVFKVIVEDENTISVYIIKGLLLGALWVLMDFPYALVKDKNGKDWARGVFICGVVSVLESWLLLLVSFHLPSSFLRDEVLYQKYSSAAPVDKLDYCTIYIFFGTITLMKGITGYFVYSHWFDAQEAVDKAEREAVEAENNAREELRIQQGRYETAQEALDTVDLQMETSEGSTDGSTVDASLRDELVAEMHDALQKMHEARSFLRRVSRRSASSEEV
mmetsp:Transcript_14235/g.31143  ORF Transcript_14235/g.31143 Transcript_14235/m.31143 type:complete len:467 (-) Transcript_14235:573-1973(-)